MEARWFLNSLMMIKTIKILTNYLFQLVRLIRIIMLSSDKDKTSLEKGFMYLAEPPSLNMRNDHCKWVDKHVTPTGGRRYNNTINI